MKKILVIGLALIMAGALSAKRYPHDSGVSVDIPGNWKVSGDEHSLSAETKDGHAHMSFIIMPADSVEAAMSALDGELSKTIQNLKHDAGQDLTINGLHAHGVDGSGTIEGHPVEVSVMIVGTPSGKILVVLAFISEEGAKKHHKAVVKILKSIKPT